MQDADPKSLGLSPEGLAKIDAALADLIAAGELAGAVTLVARHGKVAHRSVQGMKDLATAEPLKFDTIFRIFSMTKAVTAVAMMVLRAQGLWSPEDLVAKHLPEFAGVKTVDGQAAAPTLLHLLTHTMGLGYGWNPEDPVDATYLAKGVWAQANLADMSKAIAACPLAFTPGSQWRYSLGMDLQGALIEKLSGMSLPDFMREKIFQPLGMVDTDFFVPPEKLPRLATLYRMSKTKGLTHSNLPIIVRGPEAIPPLPGGGGGLYSTASDYARFAQMLLNRGELDGVRILTPESVAEMSAQRLAPDILAGGYGIGLQQIRPGYGQAYNGAVFHDPAAAGSKVGKGTYQWDGAAGTWFWVDWENDLIFVGLIQRMAEDNSPRLQAITQDLIAAALD